MGKYVASEVVKLMISRDHKIKGAKVLILGITFKENCPDIPNTRVVDVLHELKQYGITAASCRSASTASATTTIRKTATLFPR